MKHNMLESLKDERIEITYRAVIYPLGENGEATPWVGQESYDSQIKDSTQDDIRQLMKLTDEFIVRHAERKGVVSDDLEVNKSNSESASYLTKRQRTCCGDGFVIKTIYSEIHTYSNFND